jgi:hypothetical protein
MRFTRLPALAFAATAALGCAGSATVSSDGYYSATGVVYSEPPPPRVVVTPAPRPGFIWVQGRWGYHNGEWRWRDGYWQRERVGYYYSPGRWERRGRGYIYIDGRWQARDHRRRGTYYR